MVPDQAIKQGRRSHIELFWPANNSCTSGPSIFLCGMVCIYVVRQSWFQFWGSASEPSVTFCSFIPQALRTFTHSVQFFTGDASEKMYTLFTPGIFSPLCTHQIQIRKSSSKPNTFSSCCCEETFCLADDKCCSKPKQAQCRLLIVYIFVVHSSMAIFAIFNSRFEMLTFGTA